MYRMSSGYASVLVNTLSAQGLDVASLCQEAGLDMKIANKPGAFCERRAIYRLWDLAAQASGDPDIGLKAYGSFHPGSFQIVGYTMMSSLNLKKALERLVRFSPLIGTGFSLFFTSEQQNYRLVRPRSSTKGFDQTSPIHRCRAGFIAGFLPLAGGRQLTATLERGVHLSRT